MNAFTRPVGRAEWRADRWGMLRCLAVRDETPSTKTFVLAPDDGARIVYEPGQFMTFRADFGGEAVERCYTLASSAASERSVEITVKRKPGGRFSNHLHDALVRGAGIEAFGPAGRFGPASVEADRYVLLSAGSGVTPMLSVVRTAADLGIDLDASFIHVARHPREIIAAVDLVPLMRRLPNLRVATIATSAPKRWRGTVGRLQAQLLADLVPDIGTRAILCCGPEGFMADMKAAVMAAGVAEENYAEESFDFGAMEEALATGAGPTRRITFAKSGRSFDCPDGLTILQAAKAAGIPIASSCAKGMCGTCKCLMTAGNVAMAHNGGIRDREVARGFILPCSSRPNTDIVLDR
ncbi:hybrid-cluster NAD(P)-dependent oxidoreductase [Acuticoccus sp. MNP-M23]|uniref:hybrid-cluster NAD(P)-dependent oxidoreductase n=1 Tax=Acuticoccus sp. MNP-M23 TaxID=3072793 RepID=UPI0028160594|nr:hybrid-cluster NAD(P)-dependent oxidoreductase [Acuticoccus sp. MNP-M23]WMS44492.1 hybrid-cluster NAD(P)-dependent oxidoreductase [Acuticoccus sp. MNP-M23]